LRIDVVAVTDDVTNGRILVQNVLEQCLALEKRLLGYIYAINPQQIEDVVHNRPHGVLNVALQHLKAGTCMVVENHDLTIKHNVVL